MRISWVSNAPFAPTGYGQQTAEIAPKIQADGHDIAIMANYGLAGTIIEWNGLPIYPHGLDPYSNDLAPYQAQDWTRKNAEGWTFTLYDSWVFKGEGWDSLNVAAWTPVDHKPCPPAVLEFFKKGNGKRIAIAMSEFGYKELIAAGIPQDRVMYIPHSINTKIFCPTKTEIRKELGIPAEAHLTMINAANKGNVPIRKCWPEMLLAWRTFAESRSDAYLYIHSDEVGVANGFNIPRYLESINAPMNRIKIVPQYPYKLGLPNTVLANLYSTADVFLSTSRGEGFGIGVIEAQACGTPVIVTDWTAQTELAGVGWRVDGQPEWDEHQLAYWKVPNIDLIIEALNEAYDAKQDTEAFASMRAAAVEFAKQYDTDHVYATKWRPFINKLASEVANANLTPQIAANRAARRAEKHERKR
jgi:glycosyltransferase involved in cell wall biosynthesis